MSDTPKNDAEDGSAPLFSRSGMSGVGKCTEVLKTHVPLETDHGFKVMATAAGCSPSELLRDLVCIAVHKKTYAELVAEQRRRMLDALGIKD